MKNIIKFENCKVIIIALFLTLGLAINGCISPQKYLARAQYDAAISKAAKKLRKNPSKTQYFDIIKEAYAKANQFDKEAINSLKNAGEEEVWDRIYNIYNSMNYRQNIIKTLPSNYSSQFKYVNYDEEIKEAKNNAALYYYNRGNDYLSRKTRDDARLAYYEFVKVKNLFSNYKNIDALIDEAKFLGTTVVLYQVFNNSQRSVPIDFLEDMLVLDFPRNQWIEYITNPKLNYSYVIECTIENMMLSPESIKEKEETFQGKVKEGWEYVYDANGNVTKDANGNDVKKDKYVNYSCNVINCQMSKFMRIDCNIRYFDPSNGSILFKGPVNAEYIFNYSYAKAVGKIEVLPEEVKKRLNNKVIPFPNEFDMLKGVQPILKKQIFDIVIAKKNLFR